MENEIIKVTKHYGYKRVFLGHFESALFAVYNTSGKQKTIVSAFRKENNAKRECRYLEGLNYENKCCFGSKGAQTMTESKLIYAEDLKKELLSRDFFPALVKHAIEKCPAVDAVEVVRCKDCKRSGMYCFGASSEERLACLEVDENGFIRFASSVGEYDYCSRGERKDND